MFFRTKNKNKAEDLNRKVERYKRWWQDQTWDIPCDRSNRSKEKNPQKPFDSSFVYYEEG